MWDRLIILSKVKILPSRQDFGQKGLYLPFVLSRICGKRFGMFCAGDQIQAFHPNIFNLKHVLAHRWWNVPVVVTMNKQDGGGKIGHPADRGDFLEIEVSK